jgi:hypothetical protein
MKMRKKACSLLFVALIMTGCQAKNSSIDDRTALLGVVNPKPIVLSNNPELTKTAEKVKHEVGSFNELYDVSVIVGDHTILIAYKVKHLHRFKMKKIEKDLTKRLEKEYPDEKFVVTSDYKLFLESIRLNEKIKKKNLSNKEANKQLKKLVQMTKERT